MSHVPETELALCAVQPEAVAAERRREIEEHLALCAECQELSDFFRTREDDLEEEVAEPDTWEPAIGNATYDSLMAMGALIAREDAEAEVLLKEFIESPITAAWATLSTWRRFRTGGVVRKLNAASHSVWANDPLAALTFADAAISVAEGLPDDLYPANAVYRLRGTAWKERANAQMLLGQLPEAHDSLDRAERAYSKTYHGLGLSIVALARAAVFYEQERFDEAMTMAERAEVGFAHSVDEERRIDALFMRAAILQRSGLAREAVPLFRQIIDYGENFRNPLRVARGSYALGNCEIDLGSLSDATVHLHEALRIFRDIGPEPDRVATEWGIACVILRSGKLLEAIRRLRDVSVEFERRGMVTDAALVGLDIAEALLPLGRRREIVELAQHLFKIFTQAGVLNGSLSALAYLKEAAAADTLTPAVLIDMRSFLRRAERQPELQFAPPPR